MFDPRPVVAAFAEAMFPAEPDAPGGSDIVPDALEDLLASMDPADVKQLHVALRLFELGAIPRYGRRFTKLSADKQERYALAWMRSRLALQRTIFRALRGLCANLYYNDARTWTLLDYDGPMVKR